MTSPTRFQIGAALLVASLSTLARASDITGDAPDTRACVAEYRIVFRSEGHPGKSTPFLRQEVAASSQCQNAPSPLYLTVFTDAPGGAVLLEGDYANAIGEIRKLNRVPAVTSLHITNLCVAQIASREWADARNTCDAAIKAARLDKVRAPSWPSSARARYKDFVAVAYSNRAVLSLLSADMTAGEDDLLRAQKIAPRAQFVKLNLAATRLVREARVMARTTPEG
jgi:hypothetical protein